MYKSQKSSKVSNCGKSLKSQEYRKQYWKYTKFEKQFIDYTDPKVKVFGSKRGRKYGVRLDCAKTPAELQNEIESFVKKFNLEKHDDEEYVTMWNFIS